MNYPTKPQSYKNCNSSETINVNQFNLINNVTQAKKNPCITNTKDDNKKMDILIKKMHAAKI